MSLQNCTKGKHELEVILDYKVTGLYDRVVRWCRFCGGTVVDTEYDGKTQPGQMVFPDITYKELGKYR